MTPTPACLARCPSELLASLAPPYCVTSVSHDSLCTSGGPARGFEALGLVQVSPYCGSPPSSTSLGPSLLQLQVLPLQNLANSIPVLAAPGKSLTLAQDEEKQEPTDHGVQPHAKSVQKHGLFAAHCCFHPKTALVPIQRRFRECLNQVWSLDWSRSRRG